MLLSEVPKPPIPDVETFAKSIKESLVRIEQMGKTNKDTHPGYINLVKQALELSSRITKETTNYIHNLSQHHQTKR